MHGPKLDHYEEQEKEKRSKEEVKVDIKEEINKVMKQIQCVPNIAGLVMKTYVFIQIWTF